jgi:hypothetical protein
MSIDKEHLSKMINSLANDDGESFAADFDSVIRSRISSEIAVQGLDIHSNLLNTEEPDANESFEVYEAKNINSDTFTFKNSATLKKFVDAVKEAGGGKKGIAGPDIHIKGNSVYIGVADKSTLEILSFLAKDFKATTTKTENTDFISILSDIFEEGSKYIILMDESSVFIDKNMAKSLARLHDSLNNDNQRIMKDLIFKSNEGYKEISELAKETENDII